MHNLAGDKLKELLNRQNKLLKDLAAQTDIAAARWSQIVNGTKRLSIDLAIRLGKVFPDINVRSSRESINGWIELQASSDKMNAEEQDGPMYRNIRPFEDDK